MGLIKKDDLIKLKQSKPVPITAHSGELVVPVVYANTVQKFLKKKNVKLPLTQNQLAAMKKKANKIAVKKQPKGVSVKKAKGTSQQQTVIVNIHKNKRAASSQPQRPSAASHLASIASRANNFAAISPYNLGPQMIGAPLDDKAKLAALLKHFEEQIKKPEPQSHTSARIHDDEKKIENQFKPVVEPTQPIRPVIKPIQIPGEYEHYKKTDTPLTRKPIPDFIVGGQQTEMNKHKRELEKRIEPIVPVAQPLREAHIDRIDVPKIKRPYGIESPNGVVKPINWQKWEQEHDKKVPGAVLRSDEIPIPRKKRTLQAAERIQKDLEAKGYVDASRP
jgi:hypothetical protein